MEQNQKKYSVRGTTVDVVEVILYVVDVSVVGVIN